MGHSQKRSEVTVKLAMGSVQGPRTCTAKSLLGKTQIKAVIGRQAHLCYLLCMEKVFLHLCIRILFQLCKMEVNKGLTVKKIIQCRRYTGGK